MSEYVWCTAEANLADGRWNIRLNRGEVWWADDPVVLTYPQYFSSTPLFVQGTTGRTQPGATPAGKAVAAMSAAKSEPAAIVPVVDDAAQAVAAVNRARTRRG